VPAFGAAGGRLIRGLGIRVASLPPSGRRPSPSRSGPARVFARIDDYARRHGESRSGFLVRAARQAMRGG
jgi:hypothetical protein